MVEAQGFELSLCLKLTITRKRAFRRVEVLTGAGRRRRWSADREGPDCRIGNTQYRLLWDDRRVTPFRRPSNNSNGNSFDFQGRQLSTEDFNRRVVRWEHDGTMTVIADSFDGKALNSPNDLVNCRTQCIAGIRVAVRRRHHAIRAGTNADRGRFHNKCKPNAIVVMDNVNVHKVEGVREAIEAAGATLRYCRPYLRTSIQSSCPWC